MLPTTNILQRTFQLRIRELSGTCFTLDHENRQYIITARHLMAEMTNSAIIKLRHEKEWKDFPVHLVGHARGHTDISVLAPLIQISPTLPLPPSSKGITFGQDVYFLGFPYNLHTDVGNLNRNFPVPFIKKATLSAMDSNLGLWYLDGHNNSGFSGGPVVFSEPHRATDDLRVAAVISGYRPNREPVYLQEATTPFEYEYNTGIIHAFDINHAMQLIRLNPIGFDLGQQGIS